jgi:hypothetical protein
MGAWFGRLVELSVNFIHTAVCISELQFVSWGKVSKLLSYLPSYKTVSFFLLTEVTGIRLVKLFVHAFSDITSWLACVTVTATLWGSLVLLGRFVSSTSGIFSIHTKSLVKLISDQNLEGPRNKKKCIFFQQRQNEPVVKSPARNDGCGICFLNYYTAKYVKRGDWVCCQKFNIWYHEISVGAIGKREFICGRCHWSELYHQVIGTVLMRVHFRSIIRSSLFFNNYRFKPFHMKEV